MLNSHPLWWEKKSFCTFVLLGGCCRAVFEQKKPAQSPLAEHGHTGKLSFQEPNTETSKLYGGRTELASGKHKNHHGESFETRPALAEAGMLPCPPPYGSTAPFLPTRKRCSTLLRSAQLTAGSESRGLLPRIHPSRNPTLLVFPTRCLNTNTFILFVFFSGSKTHVT